MTAVLGMVAGVVSSPLRRARDTAAHLARGQSVAVDDRWIEIDYGYLDGRALEDVPEQVWHRWRGDARYRPDGGESLTDVSTRVTDACGELFALAGTGARTEGSDVVVVSHVSPIKAAVAWCLGVDPLIAWRLRLSTGSITRVSWENGIPLLVGFNEVPPLG